MKKIVFFIMLMCAFSSIKAQDLPIYNHYFIYPNLYNPAYLGLAEYSEITLLHRQQWVGIDGAPVISNLGLQMPISSKMAFGVNVGNNEIGLLNSTFANGSFAYTLPISNRSFLSFGLNIGAGRQAIDVDQINDLTDPAIAGTLDRSFFLTGQAGFTFQYKKLNVGFSLPNLFENEIFSDSDFQEIGLDALSTTVSSVRYNFDLNPYVSFEPSVLLISNETVNSQFKGAGTFYIKDLVWIGGIYGEDSGATIFGGLNVNDLLKIGYSYDLNPPQVSGFSNGTHEFILRFRFGKKKINRFGQPDNLIAENTQDIQSEIEKPEELDEETEELSGPPKKKKKRTRKKVKEENISFAEQIENANPKPKDDNGNKEVDDSILTSNDEQKKKTSNETPSNPPEVNPENNTIEKDDTAAVEKEVTKVEEENPKKVGNEEKISLKMDPPPFRPDEIKETENKSTEDITEEEKELERVNEVVTISKGEHSEELSSGYYVVVGAFRSEQNAENYQNQLSDENFKSRIGFNSETGLNYVYVTSADAITDVIDIKNEYRQKELFQFEDTWILRIR